MYTYKYTYLYMHTLWQFVSFFSTYIEIKQNKPCVAIREKNKSNIRQYTSRKKTQHTTLKIELTMINNEINIIAPLVFN